MNGSALKCVLFPRMASEVARSLRAQAGRAGPSCMDGLRIAVLT